MPDMAEILNLGFRVLLGLWSALPIKCQTLPWNPSWSQPALAQSVQGQESWPCLVAILLLDSSAG